MRGLEFTHSPSRIQKIPPVEGDVILALRYLDASLAMLDHTHHRHRSWLCKRLQAFTLQETFILFPTPFHHVIGLGPGHIPQIGDPKTGKQGLWTEGNKHSRCKDRLSRFPRSTPHSLDR